MTSSFNRCIVSAAVASAIIFSVSFANAAITSSYEGASTVRDRVVKVLATSPMGTANINTSARRLITGTCVYSGGTMAYRPASESSMSIRAQLGVTTRFVNGILSFFYSGRSVQVSHYVYNYNKLNELTTTQMNYKIRVGSETTASSNSNGCPVSYP